MASAGSPRSQERQNRRLPSWLQALGGTSQNNAPVTPKRAPKTTQSTSSQRSPKKGDHSESATVKNINKTAVASSRSSGTVQSHALSDSEDEPVEPISREVSSDSKVGETGKVVALAQNVPARGQDEDVTSEAKAAKDEELVTNSTALSRVEPQSEPSDAAPTCSTTVNTAGDENRKGVAAAVGVTARPVRATYDAMSDNSDDDLGPSASARGSTSNITSTQNPTKDPNTTTSNPTTATSDPATATTTPSRQSCMYGAKCYRRNPDHRRQLAHPGDSDYQDLPACPYGTSCYRRNRQHRRMYSHTGRPKRTAVQNRRSLAVDDDSDESDDLFADGDSESDDYLPDGSGSDDDKDWSGADEDSEELVKKTKKARH